MSDSESDYDSMRERIDLKELRVVDEAGDSGEDDNGGEFDTLSEASDSSGCHASGRRKRRGRPHTTRRETARHHRSRSPVRSRRHKTRGSLSDRFHCYEDRLQYLFRGARFFMIKSGNPENIALSKIKGVWSTLPINENKLNQAVRTSKNIILIFSVKESMKFSGFARLAGESRHDMSPVNWVLPPNINPHDLGGVFKVDWICRKDLPFLETAHLKNSWNMNKPIKIGRDGQEIEPGSAKKLCLLFPRDHNIDMEKVLRRSRYHAACGSSGGTAASGGDASKRRLQSQVVHAPAPSSHSYSQQGYHHPPPPPPRDYYPPPAVRYHPATHPYYMIPPHYDPPPPPRYYDGPPLPPDISKHYVDYFYHDRPYFPGRPVPHGIRR